MSTGEVWPSIYFKEGLLLEVHWAVLNVNESTYHSQTIRLGEPTSSSIAGQEAVLQVNHCLPNLLILRQHVIIIQHDL